MKYANFSTIVKCRFHGLKSLLWKKQHDQTTIPISLVQKSMARKIFGTSDENRGLTCFKICKFFDYIRMSFLWAKKPPFEKTTRSNDKTKDLLNTKVGSKDIWN